MVLICDFICEIIQIYPKVRFLKNALNGFCIYLERVCYNRIRCKMLVIKNWRSQGEKLWGFIPPIFI